MKVLILLLVFIVLTCQAHQWPLNRRLVARQGDDESNLSVNDQLYEKLKKLVKKYMIDEAEDPNILTLLVPDIFESNQFQSRRLDKRRPGPHINSGFTNPAIHHQYPHPVPTRISPVVQYQYSNRSPYRFTSPGIHTRFSEADQIQQVAQADQEAQRFRQVKAEQAARLAQVDKEALSKLSEEDRQIIESRLSPIEREILLTRLEDGQLDDILPREENRFGSMGSSMNGISGAVAQIGATAGRYIGGKLAGTLGARLGAAAGAYLGAAAASRFVKKTLDASEVVSNDDSEGNITEPSFSRIHYGGFGAIMVNNT